MSEAAAAKEKPRATMIVPQRFGTREHKQNHWIAYVEDGDHPEDFRRPEYWALIAKDLQPHDIITVIADDGTYWGEFLVRQCERTWAKLHPLREVKLDAEPLVASDKANFKVEWKGTHLKWCVIRLNDGSIVHEGEQEKIGATMWLDGYAKTVGTKAA